MQQTTTKTRLFIFIIVILLYPQAFVKPQTDLDIFSQMVFTENVLTQKDLDQIEDLMEEKFDEKLRFLPTKDEFYKTMDEMMGELKTIREAQTIITHRVYDHEDRIIKLEEKTGIATI